MQSAGDELLENYTGLVPWLWRAVLKWKERSQYEKLPNRNEKLGENNNLSWGPAAAACLMCCHGTHDDFKEMVMMEAQDPGWLRKLCSQTTRHLRYIVS